MKCLFSKKGQAFGAVGAVISLIVGIGVSVLVLVFVGSLGGQTWELVENDVDKITNETVRAHIRNGVISGFNALEQTGNYLPIIVMAVIISLVMYLILGMAGGVGAGRGGVL